MVAVSTAGEGLREAIPAVLHGGGSTTPSTAAQRLASSRMPGNPATPTKKAVAHPEGVAAIDGPGDQAVALRSLTGAVGCCLDCPALLLGRHLDPAGSGQATASRGVAAGSTGSNEGSPSGATGPLVIMTVAPRVAVLLFPGPVQIGRGPTVVASNAVTAFPMARRVGTGGYGRAVVVLVWATARGSPMAGAPRATPPGSAAPRFRVVQGLT